MDVLTVAAVLSLLSVSAAKPLNCEDLIEPIALNKTQITGKWFLIEGILYDQNMAELWQTTYNFSSLDIAISHNGTSATKEVYTMNGICQSLIYNTTFSNNSLHLSYENGTSTCLVLPSPPDYLDLRCISVYLGDIIPTLNIYGRTKTLSQSASEMYEKQLECLEFPQSSAKYYGVHDICPDEEAPAVTEKDKQAVNR